MERNSGEEGDSSASSEWNDVRLECAVADAGHPRAALRWAVNGRPVEAAAEDADANSRCSHCVHQILQILGAHFLPGQIDSAWMNRWSEAWSIDLVH